MTRIGRCTGRTTQAVKTALLGLRHRNSKLPIVIHCPTLTIFKYIKLLILRLASEQGLAIQPRDIIYSHGYGWRGLENFTLVTDHTIYEYGSPTEIVENYEISALMSTRMRGKKLYEPTKKIK